MLRIDYVDVNGATQTWLQGFYGLDEPNVDYPTTCVRCANVPGVQEHRQINEKAWYTFTTGNLFTILPEDRKPASILTVKFYASGHEYDTYVSEMALLAGNSEQPIDQGNAG